MKWKQLANSFNQMVERLSVAADDRARLQKELLEKQKLDQELSLAAEIQHSFQPVTFPCSSWFCTSARTMPAQVVGGDFYDFIDLGGRSPGNRDWRRGGAGHCRRALPGAADQ